MVKQIVHLLSECTLYEYCIQRHLFCMWNIVLSWFEKGSKFFNKVPYFMWIWMKNSVFMFSQVKMLSTFNTAKYILVIWSPGSKSAIEELNLQPGFDSESSLAVMKGATLSTPPSTGLSGIQFSNTPNYISWSRKKRKYRQLHYGRRTGRHFTATTQALNSCYTVDRNEFWWYDKRP